MIFCNEFMLLIKPQSLMSHKSFDSIIIRKSLALEYLDGKIKEIRGIDKYANYLKSLEEIRALLIGIPGMIDLVEKLEVGIAVQEEVNRILLITMDGNRPSGFKYMEEIDRLIIDTRNTIDQLKTNNSI